MRPRREESPDEVELARLRAGDASVVRDLLSRHDAVVRLFARVAAGDGRSGAPGDAAVADCWRVVLAEWQTTDEPEAPRVAMLRRLAATLGVVDADPDERGDAAAPLGTFEPEEDEWAGWWSDPPPPWPGASTPGRADVLAALARLPLALRALLVLRECAGVPARDAARILPRVAGRQAELLERARERYLVALEQQMVQR